MKKGKEIILPAFSNGLGGSRTRVQKFIPCPSTIVVNYSEVLHLCSLKDPEIDNQILSVAS